MDRDRRAQPLKLAFRRGGKALMDDEAPPPGGLDANGTAHSNTARGARWGRRTPYGLRRDGGRRDDRRPPARDHAATYAALDLGTNNCRLLVARPTSDGFRVVDAFSRIIRLGEGIAASRRISEAAIARAVDALLVCRDKMRARDVIRARLIATEACRAAENGEEFRGRIARDAGVELEIIDSATEARLAATGCTELFDPAASGVILFDIGGGSSELVRLNRPAAGRRRSAAAGHCRLGLAAGRRRHAGRALRRQSRDSRTSMTPWWMRSPRSSKTSPRDHRCDLDGFHMLGTSGTVTTIAGVFLRLRRYDRRRVDGCWLCRR